MRPENFDAFDPITITIANGQTVSSAALLNGLYVAAIQLPSAFTGTTFTLQGSIDGGATYKTLTNNAGSALVFTAVADRIYVLGSDITKGLDYLKVVSGLTELAQRSIIIKPAHA